MSLFFNPSIFSDEHIGECFFLVFDAESVEEIWGD